MTERRLSAAEGDIKELTRNVTILTQDVQAMLRTQAEIATLIREQAVHERDIKQAIHLAELALERCDEMKRQLDEVRTEIKVHKAVESARLGMMQALLKYWPIWTAIAALGILSGLTIQNIKF